VSPSKASLIGRTTVVRPRIGRRIFARQIRRDSGQIDLHLVRVVNGLTRPTPWKSALLAIAENAPHLLGKQLFRHAGWDPQVRAEHSIQSNELRWRDGRLPSDNVIEPEGLAHYVRRAPEARLPGPVIDDCNGAFTESHPLSAKRSAL